MTPIVSLDTEALKHTVGHLNLSTVRPRCLADADIKTDLHLLPRETFLL